MKRSNLWTGFTSLLSCLLVIAILAMNTMMIYSTTINGELGIVTSQVINPEGTDLTELNYFPSEYGELNAENLQTLIADTYDHAVAEQEEGSVLLFNDGDVLPLTGSERSVTLFGHTTAQPLYKAHSAGSSGYEGEYNIDFYKALSDAGFDINDTLYDAYVASPTTRSTGVAIFGQDIAEYSIGEEDISFYTDDIRSSWSSEYNDVAIVMFSREAGEGNDINMITPDSGISQLALQQEERDLLQLINESGSFNKVIVLLNTGWAMELGELKDYGVDACLWIGLPGQRGFEGVANILTGDANPSGKLVDTYAVNSLSAPATVYANSNTMEWENIDEIVAATDGFEADTVGYYSIQAENIYILDISTMRHVMRMRFWDKVMQALHRGLQQVMRGIILMR
ncbi:MAG: glycoside hydrolase family 3 protein [Suipraeoptans sp.]